MKTTLKTLFLLTAALGLAIVPASAHGDKKVAGPNGGRIFTSVKPHVEFFVTPDRKIQLTFLDEHNKPVAPSGQTATVTTGSRTAPTVLSFSRQGDVLLSDAALPEGDGLPAVVQLKENADAKAVVERFNLNLSTCPGCSHAEYACTCGH